MDAMLILLVVLGIIAIFGLLVYLTVVSNRREGEKKRTVAHSLGFNPIEADAVLLERITRLYKHSQRGQQFELRNVSRRSMLDGELILFDLVDTAGDDDSYPEKQAVAVISPYLNLPDFMVFPKVYADGIAADLANRAIQWVITKFGTPVEFPEVPEFEKRYLVSSPDPDSTRGYLNQTILHRLAQTSYLTIHAGGDIIAIGDMPLSGKSSKPEGVSERVKQAMDIYTIFSLYADRS